MSRQQPALYPDEMYALLVEKAAERHARSNHVMVDQWPNLTEIDENVILGSFSWAGMSSKTRWLKRSTAVSVGGFMSTPGDIARDYLTIKFPKRKRITAEQKREILKHRSQPVHAFPLTLPDATYLDLRSAYWSIMSVVGWNVDYFPGRWLAAGEAVTDFPFHDNKIVRNCLVTSGLTSSARIWMHETQSIAMRSFGNKLVNYQLWSLIQDVLNSIAVELMDTEAVYYVNTDGYILPTSDIDIAKDVIHQWRLPSREKKRGRCYIQAVGRYKFGVLNDYTPVGGSSTTAIYDADYRVWLKSRFSTLALSAQPELNYGD
jgi:hypothetical protein